MALVTQNTGELKLLEWMLRDTSTPENLTLKLFSNNYTPVATTSTGDLTEAAWTGYSAATLSRGSWSAAATVSGKAVCTYAAQTFLNTSGSSVTAYGYYVVGATSGTLLWAERFATPQVIAATTGELSVTPSISLNSEA